MQTANEKVKTDLHFVYFPQFAKFLLDDHLTDFVKEQLLLSNQMQLRLLSYFASMSDDEMMAFGKKSAGDFLQYIAENRAKEQIEDARQRWLKDQLPNLSRDQVIAEDIIAISFVRKQAFLKFIPLFTTDILQAMELIKEIDRYLLASETVFTDTYIDLLNNRIDEHARGLMQKNLLLEQSNANLEEFAYVASHDLKEPLRKISIFGDRLLSTQYQYLAADGQLYLEKIIDSSRKMQALINDLLSLSLISGNKSFVHHSLQDIMNDVLRTLDHEIEEKQATVHVQPLPEAKIIPSQFRQLFQNLLSNSLKFVKQDVKPEIFVNYRWLRYKDVEQYRLIRSRSYLEITFTDNGIGFDNMFAGKIFAIFQRLNQKAHEGTGIGLAICKKIVENHGGVIFASGEPGNGATFTFIIPV